MASSSQVSPDTIVTLKVNFDGVFRRFKIPLREVGVNVFENKLRSLLNIDGEALIERYSDSAGAYVVLSRSNAGVYKQLYRAAKAKQKLKLRVSAVKETIPTVEEESWPKPATVEDAPEEAHVANESVETPEDFTPSDSTPVALPTPPQEPTQEPTPSEAPMAPIVMGPIITSSVFDDLRALESLVCSRRPGTLPSPVRPTCPALRTNYAVCCNSCDRTIPEAHYHCSTCDGGDFDLCQECVEMGVTCNDKEHWLIKRFVTNGVIINSTTERLPPKQPKPTKKEEPKVEEKPVVEAAAAPVATPTAPERIIPAFKDFLYSSIRTCNCCVQELPEVEFVHCTTCEDFDLCRACFAKNRHGHHPKHAFVAAVVGTRLEPEVSRRLGPGRGQAHNAICDGCDDTIRGIRHKCLDCPDWDYCSTCVTNAAFIHPGHRFVPVYEQLEDRAGVRNRTMNRPIHYGICCDGPLCAGRRATSYITGDRYKCAVCHDLDYCENCEASPANSHNRTHPLIKFKTPVRNVNVVTTGEGENGRQLPLMGDRSRPSSVTSPATETSTPPVLKTNMQTVVDMQPSEPTLVEADKVEEVKEEVKEEVGEQVKEEVGEQVKEEAEQKPAAVVPKTPSVDDLVAVFVRDTVADGTAFEPDHVFEQTWVLRNDGKVAWPAGCSVRYAYGDYMGHVDPTHPAATQDVQSSNESTICYSEIAPGEEFPFTVLLRTPQRPGRFVSHWRLSTKDGIRFGHRLWVDILVEKPKAVAPPAVEVAKEDVVEAKEVVPTPAPEVEKAEPAQVSESQMIFPKLDKESPVTSVHSEMKPQSASVYEDYEDCEDDEWERSDEGFLTDEEYDILDASDDEYLVGKSSK